MSQKLRTQFLEMMGETYEEYGYANICGWIEGLLLLEAREWTQKGISKHLGQLFPDSKYPTSVPSVNRALKILESYGVIERSGSRKIGYRYRPSSSSSLVVTMLQQTVTVNENFMRKMESLLAKSAEADPELDRAVSYQINGAKLWNELVARLLRSVSKDEGTEEKKG
jgi:DNA-binding transcriptional regulator GbsR (MarR family)